MESAEKQIRDAWAKLRFLEKRDFRRQVARWEGLFRPAPEREFFRGAENMPLPDPTTPSFHLSNAWWLAELCRLAYTPDEKEAPRKRNENKPDRSVILSERTPFEELVSVHKTGNHASVYRLSLESGAPATVLCFRGTANVRQWIANSLFRPHRWQRFRMPNEPEDASVHSGFYVLFKRMWPLILPTLEQLPRPWVFTGHSLGGALATIASSVAEPEWLITFGSPKVGNTPFGRLLDEKVRHTRIVNRHDIVPLLPAADEHLKADQFRHCGNYWWINHEGELENDSQDARTAADTVPFTKSYLASDLTRPPEWFTDHSMGQYCRKLRRNVLLDGENG